MKQHLVFSLLGPDRTGLVDRVAQTLARHHANLEDSRMAVLGGEFSMMFLCSLEASGESALVQDLNSVAGELELLLQHKKTTARRSHSGMMPLQVSVRGADHEGIVHDLVHHLVEQGVSVDNLESQLVNAPYSGVPLFEMQMRISAPASVSLSTLRRKLQAAGDELNVDVEIETVSV
ncbi:MAG: ACT domain-containing protein [Vulcanimicrobiota bacterium]